MCCALLFSMIPVSSIILTMNLSHLHFILRALWLVHAILLLPSNASSLPSRSLTSTTILEGSNNATDRLALLSFKSMISNDPFQALASWNDSIPICHWEGVTCGRRHPERVTALSLDSLNLLGSVSPSLANLTFLRRLHLPNNRLHGRIPPELGNLSRLRHLNLSINTLDGEIPSTLSHCPLLQVLILGNNMLQGEIPSNLGQCRELQILNLRNNFLTGSIPEVLGSLSKLSKLDLSVNNLTGSIPPSLGNLSSLVELDINTNSISGIIPSTLSQLSFLVFLLLQSNKLVGSIPSSLGRLSSLQFLGLSHNNLQGDISPTLGNLSSLLVLDLSQNNLTGTIPPSLGNLSSLIEIDLRMNTLSGEIPPSLGFLPSLSSLYLTGNSLSGHIPSSLGSLHSLTITHLHLSHNNLSGRIPSSIYNISNLLYLGVADNELIGTLPPDLGYSLPKLQVLLMYFNQFHGPIPASLANASSLQLIDLSANWFTGTIPTNLGTLPELYWLGLYSNQLEAGVVDGWSFLTSLMNCSKLRVLQLDENRVRGALPGSIANLSTTLQKLTMGDNKISGSLPSEIGRLYNLTTLLLYKNLLTGNIPDSIGKLQSLQLIDLSHNNLSGPIPTSISNLTQLNILSLGDNSLTGPIPTSIGNLTGMSELFLGANLLTGSIPMTLGNCQALVYLDLQQNRLTGGIPKEVVNLASLSKYLGLSHNSFVGPIPLEIGSLKNLGVLDLSENNLTDEIPGSIGECQVLEEIYMEGNHLQGIIPESMSNLKGLQKLDLSRNNLSGGIPQFLTEFRFLQFLNLSFNNFEGEVPTKGVFRNLSAISVIGNSGLCGGDPKLHLKKCSTQTNKRRNGSHPIKVIAAIAAVVLCLVLIICLLIIHHRLHSSRKEVPTTASVEEQHPRISYSELLKATDGFSLTNLIGVGSYGSVYKGIMDFEREKIVAVKVLNLQQRGASRSFMAECNALRRIRHRNLIKVITSCSSIDYKGDDFKALVFEFMPNGSLEEWLHPQARDQSQEKNLSLIQRLNIAIDIASAMDYLHHHGPTPIVHCDLKPSNVLLDEDMTAHVGDFGLARFLTKTISMPSQNRSTSIGVKGTIGYVAPEYGVANQVSTQGDVYSYGILLLEIFTGKRPIDDERWKEGTSLCKFVEMAFPERVVDIIDPRLLLEENDGGANDQIQNRGDIRQRTQECFISMIKLGLSCSKDSPKERMQMGEVIKELLLVRNALIVAGIHQERRNRDRFRGEGPSSSTVDDDE